MSYGSEAIARSRERKEFWRRNRARLTEIGLVTSESAYLAIGAELPDDERIALIEKTRAADQQRKPDTAYVRQRVAADVLPEAFSGPNPDIGYGADDWD